MAGIKTILCSQIISSQFKNLSKIDSNWIYVTLVQL